MCTAAGYDGPSTCVCGQSVAHRAQERCRGIIARNVHDGLGRCGKGRRLRDRCWRTRAECNETLASERRRPAQGRPACAVEFFERITRLTRSITSFGPQGRRSDDQRRCKGSGTSAPSKVEGASHVIESNHACPRTEGDLSTLHDNISCLAIRGRKAASKFHEFSRRDSWHAVCRDPSIAAASATVPPYVILAAAFSFPLRCTLARSSHTSVLSRRWKPPCSMPFPSLSPAHSEARTIERFSNCFMIVCLASRARRPSFPSVHGKFRSSATPTDPGGSRALAPALRPGQDHHRRDCT